MIRLGALAGAILVTATSFGAPAHAQDTPAPAATPAPAPVAAGMVRLPVMTPVEFEFRETIKSNSFQIDEMFGIRLTAPIVVNGVEVVPAGTEGKGQVVHAAKAGWGGKAGELIVAARFIDFQGVHIPLRRLRMGGIGQDRVGEAFVAASVVPLAGFLVSGGEKEIPAGTRANAIVSADTDVPAPKASN